MAGLGTPWWLWGSCRGPTGPSRGHCRAGDTVAATGTILGWGPQPRQVVENPRIRMWKWTVTPGVPVVTLSLGSVVLYGQSPWPYKVPVPL